MYCFLSIAATACEILFFQGAVSTHVHAPSGFLYVCVRANASFAEIPLRLPSKGIRVSHSVCNLGAMYTRTLLSRRFGSSVPVAPL